MPPSPESAACLWQFGVLRMSSILAIMLSLLTNFESLEPETVNLAGV